MPYLDKEQEFYDYGTGRVSGKDVIDTTKTGTSFYDDFFTQRGRDYLEKEHNLKGEIVYMTPNEYYEQCGKYGFPNSPISPEKLKMERARDKSIIDHLTKVLTVYKRKFPLPYISIAEKGQEGLHRFYTIGELFGWDNHKYPVLVVTHADEERARQRALAKRANSISSNIRYAIRDTLNYYFEDFEELKEQLQWCLDEKFQFDDEIKKPVQFTIEEDPSDPDYYIVKVDIGEADFEKSRIHYVEPKEDKELDNLDIEDIELDDIDTSGSDEDFLKRYFGDDWRETHPYLKDAFGIKENINESADELTTVGLGIKLRKDIEKGWTKETCHPSYVDKWTIEYPSTGQCAITTMYLNEKMGWDIYETTVSRSRHFFNKDTNGFIYDLTADQFQDSDINYENCRKREFKDLYRSCKDRYELFKSNLNNNLTESVERLDINQMDEYVQNRFGADVPAEGCIFIAPNGKFINIYPTLDDHEDLCYWLEENGFDDNPEDAGWFVDEFKYIRCRNSLHLCFADLPSIITNKQIYSLEEWFETKVCSNSIQISVPNGKWRKYNLNDYFPEDIIKLIKRYYSSGTLYE